MEQLPGLGPGADHVQAGAVRGGAAGRADQRPEPAGVDEADLVQVGDHRAAFTGQREQPRAEPGYGGDVDFPGRWRSIKTAFSKSLPRSEPRSPVMTRRGERGIWQRRYWEHTICDDRDFAIHMDYTHFNPVKHGLVGHPADWPHSSFRRCVDGGLYPDGWRGGSDEPQETGEGL